MARLSLGVIDEARVVSEVEDPSIGAVLVFRGTTRDHFEGRRVVRLDYEAHPALAVAQMEAIEQDLAQRFPGTRVCIEHRVGSVAVGEVSVVIAVGSPHRAQAYEASREAIEALKSQVAIWKKEITEDGAFWKANAPAGR